MPHLLKFVGIDSCNRPIFVDKKRNYFGCTDKLFDYDATEKDVLSSVTEVDVTFFGKKFGCEPMGSRVEDILIVRI